MTSPPPPPPEAQLLKRLREEMVPAVSQREAARRAGFSAPVWNQGEQGYRRFARGFPPTPHSMTDENLARAYQVVHGTPDQLRETGRPKAAVILEKLIAAGPDPVSQLVERVRLSSDFTDGQKRELIEAIRLQHPDSDTPVTPG